MNSYSAALNDFEAAATGSLFHKTLAVSSVSIDELRLVASGPDDQGVAFIGIDNVRVVPEPSVLGTWSLLKRHQKTS